MNDQLCEQYFWFLHRGGNSPQRLNISWKTLYISKGMNKHTTYIRLKSSNGSHKKHSIRKQIWHQSNKRNTFIKLISEEVAGITESAKERTSESLNWILIVLFIHFDNLNSEILTFYYHSFRYAHMITSRKLQLK